MPETHTEPRGCMQNMCPRGFSVEEAGVSLQKQNMRLRFFRLKRLGIACMYKITTAEPFWFVTGPVLCYHESATTLQEPGESGAEETEMKKILLPGQKGILYGGDYNPDQWLDRSDILQEDIRLMKKAGINSATLGVFAWAAYEPAEDEFHFDWLIKIMDELYAAGICTVLATPTGARPTWMDEKYPECMRVGRDGVRAHHGGRHNFCMSSPEYRRQAEKMIRALARAVKGHPGLVLWHLSNELSGECFCPLCQAKFRDYLRVKFHNNIDELNHEWWTAFWSHTYQSFDQIEAPMEKAETGTPGLNLAWREFTSWNMQQYVRFERQIVAEETPGIPACTNFMQLFGGLDYQKIAGEIDLVSWDNYPGYESPRTSLEEVSRLTAFSHANIRGTKPGQPFLMMESTPSLVNWQPYNKLRRPGTLKLSSLQAIACGSDSVQYFQWRKGRGGYEQYHGAVVDHDGRDDTRVFREVSELGAILPKLADVTGSVVDAKAAVLFDWETRWAVDGIVGLGKDSKKYVETCQKQYEVLTSLGVETDVIGEADDFAKYGVIAAPMLYLAKPGLAEKLTDYVAQGGQLVLTYLTGYVNENTLAWLGGFPGGILKNLAGLTVEETDTLYPEDRNAAVFPDGTVSEIRDYCETLRPEYGAQTAAVYRDDFYAGSPAVTRKKTGKGECWYAAARLDEAGMAEIYTACLKNAGIVCLPCPTGVEHHRRTDGEKNFDFYLNESGTVQYVTLPAAGKELISGTAVSGIVTLQPKDVIVVESAGQPENGVHKRDIL